MVEKLIGPQEAARFWTEFRDVYVAEDDIRFIKAAGFNTVRVPLHWQLFVETGDNGADRFVGPGWLLQQGISKPDLAISAGFSYAVIVSHNGCLHLEIEVNGKSAHAALHAPA